MNTFDFGFGALEGEFWRLLFAMVRIGAAMLAAPFFGSGSVPAQARVVVTGALAVLVCSWTPLEPPPAIFSAEGVLITAGEVLIGLALGFVLQLSFAAPVIAAEVIGGAMGMSMASTVDPNSGSHSPALGQYFGVVLTLVFLALGGHLHWIALLIDSYQVFPPGEVLSNSGLMASKSAELTGFASAMFATGVAIALPVTLVLLVVQVVTGVLSRSAPALNLFALGLPAGILAGLAALIVAAPLVTEQMTDLSADAIAHARSLASR